MPSVAGLVSTPVTELAIVICSPSRSHAAPSPATMRVWNGDQLRRSSRAGIVLLIVIPFASTELIGLSFLALSVGLVLQHLGDDDSGCGLHQRQVGEGLREVAEVPARVGVELLGIEAERRSDPQEP